MSNKIIFKLKGLLIVVIVVSFSMNAKVVLAGGLNENEAAVVSAAQGTFEHNGIKYQADPVFVQQLISYLNQDDVDLNASQKDEAISMMFSNIGQGVAEGYLIPVNGQDEQINGEQNKEEPSGSAAQGTAPDDSSVTDPNNGENTDADTAGDGDGSSAKASGGDKDKGNPEQGILNEIRKQPATKTEVDLYRNKVTVKKEDNSSLITVNTVIKNTGFDLSSVFIMSAGLVMVFLFCLAVTVKCNFFRQEEQEP